MLEILALAFLSYRNAMRAKLKGLNASTWALLTTLMMAVAFFLGGALIIMLFVLQSIDINQIQSTDPEVRMKASMEIAEILTANPLQIIAIDLFGFGGYLLVRYILEKRPSKKTPDMPITE
jgi:hypothetical protein